MVEVVADADLRGQLEALAEQHRARFVEVEMVCSDRDEHRRRVRSRPGHWERALGRTSRSYKPTPGALMPGSIDAPAELLETAADFVQRLTASSEA